VLDPANWRMSGVGVDRLYGAAGGAVVYALRRRLAARRDLVMLMPGWVGYTTYR
jgi:hypothetical protein